MSDGKPNLDIAKSFTGLPIGTLVTSPFLEVAKSQAALCDTYVDSIYKIAYDNTQDKKARMIEFNMERQIINTDTGEMTTQPIKVKAPLISIVPIPAFSMKEVSVEFTMEVKEQIASKDTSKKEGSVEAGGSFMGITAKISGSISSSSENTRSTDQSAKYVISAKAATLPPSEGMSRLLNIFDSLIEPVQIGGGKKPGVQPAEQPK